MDVNGVHTTPYQMFTSGGTPSVYARGCGKERCMAELVSSVGLMRDHVQPVMSDLWRSNNLL